MRKMQLSDKGKAWAGVTVADDKLMDLCRRTIKALQWRGPMEFEVMKTTDGKSYNIIEINRVPAWCTWRGRGQNLPMHATNSARAGREAAPRIAALFVRAQSTTSSAQPMETISVKGEWHRALHGTESNEKTIYHEYAKYTNEIKSVHMVLTLGIHALDGRRHGD